jgi:hypothetical protein
MATREEVYKAIDSERDYQDNLRKTGDYANIAPVLSNEIGIVKCLADQALFAISMGKGPYGAGPRSGLNNEEDSRDVLRKLIAVAVRALESHGVKERYK